MSGWNDNYRDPALIPDRILKLMPQEERKRLGKAGLTVEEHQERTKAKTEKQLQYNIASLLRQRNLIFNVSRMDRETTGTVGWPDFTFCLNGRMVCIECKLPGEKPTPEQVNCMAALASQGAFVRVVHSEAEFLKALAEVEPVTK